MKVKDKAKSKDTTFVLIEVPNEYYLPYLQVLQKKNLKRQGQNLKLFLQAIQKEVENFDESEINVE